MGEKFLNEIFLMPDGDDYEDDYEDDDSWEEDEDWDIEECNCS